MDPFNALDMLDQAVSTLPANRNTHAALIQAVNVIREALLQKVDIKDVHKTENL